MRLRATVLALSLGLVASWACKSKTDSGGGKPADNNGPKISISPSVLPDRSIAKVTKVAVVSGERALILSRKKTGWRLITASDDPADKVAVNMALRELERMELGPEPVAKNMTRWAEFGVDVASAVTLEASIGGPQPFVVHLGRKGYVRIGGDPRVYRAFHINYFTFARELRFWRARALLSLPLGAVSEATITKGAASAQAKRAGDGPNAPWKLMSGKAAVGTFDPAAPGSMATRLGTLIAHDLVSPGSVAAGLDKPRVVVVLHTAEATHTVKVGATIGEFTYLGLAEDDRVLAVKNSAIDWLLAGPKAWQSR